MGQPMPDLTLEVAAGGALGQFVPFSGLRGQVVLLDLWASFCAPCRASVPILNALSTELGPRGLRSFGINTEGLSPQRLQQVHAAWGFAYPTLADPRLAVPLAFDVQGYPTILIFDRGGHLRGMHRGVPNQLALHHQITSLLE
jgi:cytochrome c biogenesis protein CcmG/thiol:disulfide interchange protein DsbE